MESEILGTALTHTELQSIIKTVILVLCEVLYNSYRPPFRCDSFTHFLYCLAWWERQCWLRGRERQRERVIEEGRGRERVIEEERAIESDRGRERQRESDRVMKMGLYLTVHQ